MFWDKFLQLCNQKNMKPNPVAKELGISSGAVTKWKNGATPQGETLIKIAKYFGVPVGYLIDDIEKMEIREKIIGGINTALEHGQKVEVISVKATAKEWFEILSKLSDDNLIKLKEYAELLLLQQAQASQNPGRN